MTRTYQYDQLRIKKLIADNIELASGFPTVSGLLPFVEYGLLPGDPWASSTPQQTISAGLVWVQGRRLLIPETTIDYPYVDGNPNYTTIDEITPDGQYVNIDYNPVYYIPDIPPEGRMRVREVYAYGALALSVNVGASSFHCTEASPGQVIRENYAVRIQGDALPAPLEADTDYYFVNVTNAWDAALNSFQLSATSGGAPITLSTAGTNVKIAPGILASYSHVNYQATFHSEAGGRSDWRSAILSLKIQTGQYAGAFRASENGKLQWGFVVDALRCLAKYLLPEIKDFLNVSFGHLTASYTQHDLAYNLIDEVGQDADDAYGADLACLACEYVNLSGDYAWLSANSSFTHATESNLQTVKNLVKYNVLDQIKTQAWCDAFLAAHPGYETWAVPSELVSAFQNGVRDLDNAVYGAGMLMDACACAEGIRVVADMLALVNDGDYDSYRLAYYNLVTAIHRMYDSNTGIWAWVDVMKSVTYSGTCDVIKENITDVGCRVDRLTGEVFTNLHSGEIIAINGDPCQIMTVIDDDTLTILEDAAAAGVTWETGGYFMIPGTPPTVDCRFASTTSYPDLLAGIFPEYYACRATNGYPNYDEDPAYHIQLNTQRFNDGWARLCKYYPDFWSRRKSPFADINLIWYAAKIRGNVLMGAMGLDKFQAIWDGSGYISEMAQAVVLTDVLLNPTATEKSVAVERFGTIAARNRIKHQSIPQSLVTDTTIISSWECVLVQTLTAADVILTENPTISPGVDGQCLTLRNIGSYNITLRSNSEETPSNLLLPHSAIVLYPGHSIDFIFDATAWRWAYVRMSTYLHAAKPSVQELPDGAYLIKPNSEYVQLSVETEGLLYSIPTIDRGVNGQVLIIENVGSTSVTFQDDFETGTGLLLPSTELTLLPGAVIKFIFHEGVEEEDKLWRFAGISQPAVRVARSSTAEITGADLIAATHEYMLVSAENDITMYSDPTIAPGVAGQVLKLINSGSHTITLTNELGISLPAATMKLSPACAMDFIFLSGAWTLAGYTDLAAHVDASDPHTQYQKESERDTASGYAALSAGGNVLAAGEAIELTRETTYNTIAIKERTSGEAAAYFQRNGADDYKGYIRTTGGDKEILLDGGSQITGKAAKASITGATLTLAKVTSGGANGSITINTEGIVTGYTAPT